MAIELQGILQRQANAAGLTGRVLVTPYRDAGGVLRVLVNLDGWQAVSLSNLLSVPRGPVESSAIPPETAPAGASPPRPL